MCRITAAIAAALLSAGTGLPVSWAQRLALAEAPPRASAQPAEAPSAALELESHFVEVGKRVGPAVVSISIETVERVPAVRRHPFGGSPFEDDLFERFFSDFFGGLPEREFRGHGLGTGVLIDPEGYILTNEHVVHGAEQVKVTLPDGREFKGKLKGADPRSDLAVIKIDAKNLPVAQLGDSDQVKIGQWAIAIGNPFGFAVGSSEPTLTVGVVSAVNRSLRIGGTDRDYSGLIQTDAAINPGNSGVPLVNIHGEVIGINVAIFSTTGGYQGIGFAIPSSTAQAIIGDLIQGKKILYGWLGINVQDVTEELARHFGLASEEGVLVAKVLPDSPAQKGGMKDGDVIVAFEGQPIKDIRAFLKGVAGAKVGQKLPVEVIRDRKKATLSVEIGERPSDLQSWKERAEGSWRGMEVENKEEGVIVTHVEPGSSADETGIQPGDLILEVNRRPVRSVKEFAALTGKIQGDALLKTSRGFFVLKGGGS